MRFHRLHGIALGAVLATMSAGCAAPSAQPDAAVPPAAQAPAPIPQAEPAPAPAPVPARPAPPVAGSPLPAPGKPVAVSRSCQTRADCAVKDVGNCCGYAPACVNKDSPTDPAAVQAQCAKTGMASICGFREISACTCNAGQCEPAPGSGAVPVAR